MLETSIILIVLPNYYYCHSNVVNLFKMDKVAGVYHTITLRLSKRSQKFCGITTYYGSDSYLYQRLGLGLSVSPAIRQNFIQRVLQEIPSYDKKYEQS